MSKDIDQCMNRIEENNLTVNANTIITDIDSRSITASVDHSTILEEEKTNTKSNWLTYIWGDIYATDNPNQYSQKKKNVIILLVALGGLCGPLSSMMYMPGILAVAADLNTSISSVNGTISAYVVFMGISPLFWAALSDTYGRKRMYIVSGIINVISSIICAFSRNIGMLVVFRAIQSFGANAGLTLGAGVIADCISMEVRGKAYGFFYMGPLVGPVIGPTIGGFLCEYLNWQSTFYFTAVMAGVLLIMSAAFLPETLRKKRVVFEKSIDKDENPVVIEDKPPSFLDTLKVSFKPMVVMLYDPTVNLLTAYNTVIFACLYFLNPTITDTFKRIYGYTEWQVGLCYLAMGAGFMIGSVLSGQYSDYVLRKLSEQKEPGHQIVSEMRLQAAVPSFFLIPAGYLIYGWSTEKGVGVYAPLIGLFLYALGQMWAFTPTSVYLVDSKPGYSATAVGVNSCVRCLVAAITTAFSADAVHAVGTGVLFTILAVINVLNCGFVIVCYLYGYKWRLKFEEKHMPELYEISMRKTQVKKVELLEKKEDGIERIQTQHSACYSIA
ncbi:hypothetical protein INT48_003710 [Thamnidium elegans]|uniref:Major facilitator superfamily (MFS) profile domain-containing protein n=1 Tax=Thamnidium elegans TaxID=101142 RepID=A0A8H7SLT3_9FUNG|nr:hypothetical protein INT48_003710 [Thamnidium elegans]